MRGLILLPVVILSLLTGCASNVFAVEPWPCSLIDEVQGLGDELLTMKGLGIFPLARTYIVDSNAKCMADKAR